MLNLDKDSVSRMLGIELTDEQFQNYVDLQNKQIEAAKQEVLASSRNTSSKVKVSDLEKLLDIELIEPVDNNSILFNLSLLCELFFNRSEVEITTNLLWINADKEVKERIVLSKIKNTAKLISVNNKKEKDSTDQNQISSNERKVNPL